MMNPAELIVVEKKSEIAERAAGWIVELASSYVKRGEWFHIALAGGGTPLPIYEKLAADPFNSQINWKHTRFYFSDERCVPPDHPESNFGMIMRALFPDGKLIHENIFRMEGELSDPDEAARRYEEILPDKMDLVMAGMGEDAHTCSLFPGSEALDVMNRKVVATTGPKPPKPRLTFTTPVLNAASHLLMIVAGEGKATALKQVFEGPFNPKELPAQLMLKGTWIVDKAAASLLS